MVGLYQNTQYDCGDIQLTEHIRLKWLDKNNLESLDWAEADKPVVNVLSKTG